MKREYVKASDRVGTTVNGFKILDVKRENKRTFYRVECPLCKNHKWMRVEEVLNGKNKSCGCYNKEHNLIKYKDLTGERFGKLKALKPSNKRGQNGSIIWECECDCGNICEVSAADLYKLSVRSCGCLGVETSKENGKKVGNYIKENYCIDGTNVLNLTAKRKRTSISGVTGVTWRKNKWQAMIIFRGVVYRLGMYEDLEEAIKVRKEAEKQKFGSFLDWYKEEFPEKWESVKSKNLKE